MDLVIGVDFDNTLVSYDHLICRVANERGLIEPGVNETKNALRERIRGLQEGEKHWQRLQAMVYGPLMGDARLVDGVKHFFRACRERGVPLHIVSHKTKHANADHGKTNLRDAAIQWMTRNEFFDSCGMGLTQDHVYFEPTRRQKIERIKELGCTHFIDDLKEVFLEHTFPTNVEKLLFSPDQGESSLKGGRVFVSWKELNDYFFPI